MKCSHNKYFKYLILVVGMSFLLNIEAFATKYSPDVSAITMQNISKLHDAIGYESGAGFISKTYSRTSLDAILMSLDSGDVIQIEQTLYLLLGYIKQVKIPRNELKTMVKPKIDGLLVSNIDGNMKILSDRVDWHIQYLILTKKKERLEFLSENLENRRDGTLYYIFESINYLVKVGNKGALLVLQRKLDESKNRSISKKITNRIVAAIEKINILQSGFDSWDYSKKKEMINRYVKDIENKKVNNDIVGWMVDQLGTSGSKEDNQLMRELLNSKDLDLSLKHRIKDKLNRRN